MLATYASGAWKPISEVSVKVGTAWKKVTQIYTHTGAGGWKAVLGSLGKTWTLGSMPDAGSLKCVYGNGQFVCINSGAVYTSPDGTTWTVQAIPMPQYTYWTSITYGNGLYVAVGGHWSVATSPDGITWTFRSLPTGNSDLWGPNSVTYGNGTFVLVCTNYMGGASGSATSPDGINWTYHALPIVSYWSNVIYGAGLFVATSPSGVATSPNGITWTMQTMPGTAGSPWWTRTAYGNGIFITISSITVLKSQNSTLSTLTATSSDGITWTAGPNMPVVAAWGTIEFANGVFIASGGSNSGDPDYDEYYVARCTNGSDWEMVTMPARKWWFTFAYGNNKWVAQCASSPTGVGVGAGATAISSF